MTVGLLIEHYFSKNTINTSSLLIRIVFMAIGFGAALMGGFIWQNTLPANFGGQKEPVIVGAMFILSAFGFFIGYLVDRKINGKKEILAVKIDPEAVDPDDVEMLEDLIISAVNEAIRQVEEMYNNEMGRMTGGMGMF